MVNSSSPVPFHKPHVIILIEKKNLSPIHHSIRLHLFLPKLHTGKQINLLPVVVCYQIDSPDSHTSDWLLPPYSENHSPGVLRPHSQPERKSRFLHPHHTSAPLDYIKLLHESGKYEKQAAQIISIMRTIDIYENAVSAGTGNFLTDGPKKTIQIPDNVIPEATSYGVRITGDSMEPEFKDGQIAWVFKQDAIENGEIGIFSLNGDAYIQKLQDNKSGIILISLNEKYPPIPVKRMTGLIFWVKSLVNPIRTNSQTTCNNSVPS